MPKIIEVPINLGTAFLSASGCSHPERAVDSNPASVATFGPPDALDEPWTAVVNANPQPGATHSAYFGVTSAARAARFLKVVWGYETFVRRIRLKATGSALDNASVSLLSGLGLLEQNGVGDAPLIPIPLPPFPEGDGFYSVDFDLPVYALGIIVHPDAQLSAAELAQLAPGNYPTLLLGQLDVIENVEEGNQPMANPTVDRSRMGVQEVWIYPHNDGAGPYDATTGVKLRGLQSLGNAISVKTVDVTGGETVHKLDGFEDERDTKLKVASAKSNLKAIAILLGGTFAVDPAAGQVGEVQYHTENLGDRAPYFRLMAKSTVGNGTDSFVFFKCKVNGSVNYNLDKGKITELEFDFTPYYDETAVKQDGSTGGTRDWLFGSKGETTRHS